MSSLDPPPIAGGVVGSIPSSAVGPRGGRRRRAGRWPRPLEPNVRSADLATGVCRRGRAWAIMGVVLFAGGCFEAELPSLRSADDRVCDWATVRAFMGLSEAVERPDLWVAFVDVGHGDATWVRLPTRAHGEPRELVIDAGDDGYPLERSVPDGGQALAELMRWAGHRPGSLIDAVVISHPDKDHYGGAAQLLQTYRVARWIDPGRDPPAVTWLRTLAMARQTPGLVVERGARGRWLAGSGRSLFESGLGGLEVEVLGGSPTAPTENEASLVVLIRFRGVQIALMGDAGPWMERRLDLGAVDVLRVGHHGGQGGSTDAFLERIAHPSARPRFAVLSAGGRAGLPHEGTVRRLQAHVGPDGLFRTDRADEARDRRAAADGDHILLRVDGTDGRIELCYLHADEYS